ncbi:MAG: type 4a pilus biogenesis protein PilO, partial [bacterium]|nr:type 4a pilus biogenesis protein PilO [bacterium]
PIIALLSVLAIGLVFIQPTYDNIVQLNVEKTENTQKQQKMQTKLAALSRLDANKTDLQAQIVNLAVALPNQKEIPGLIIAIQKIAQASDVQIQAVQLTPGVLLNDPAIANKTAPELPFVLNIRGNYEAIKTFLGRVYKAKRLLNMNSISINTGTQAGEDGQIIASITMTGYYQPLPPTPKNVTEDLPPLVPNSANLNSKLESYTSYTLSSSEGSPASSPQSEDVAPTTPNTSEATSSPTTR